MFDVPAEASPDRATRRSVPARPPPPPPPRPAFPPAVATGAAPEQQRGAVRPGAEPAGKAVGWRAKYRTPGQEEETARTVPGGTARTAPVDAPPPGLSKPAAPADAARTVPVGAPPPGLSKPVAPADAERTVTRGAPPPGLSKPAAP